MSLVLLVALPFLASLLAALLPANARNAESTLAGVIALLCALLTALSFPDIAGGGVLRQEIAWLPTLGMNLILRLDGFAWMFCMLVLGVGNRRVTADALGPRTTQKIFVTMGAGRPPVQGIRPVAAVARASGWAALSAEARMRVERGVTSLRSARRRISTVSSLV